LQVNPLCCVPRSASRIQHSPLLQRGWYSFVSPDALLKAPSRICRAGRKRDPSKIVLRKRTNEVPPSSRWTTARASLLFFARFARFSNHAHPTRNGCDDFLHGRAELFPEANVRPGVTSPSQPLRCQEMSNSREPSAGALQCHHTPCNPPGARSVQSRKHCRPPCLAPSPILS
jgi:hypothetical protein